MSNNLSVHIIRFVVLALLQVLLLNHIYLFGYINPYLYVLFILLLPVGLSEWKVIFWAFLIGLTIDLFEDSGGIHAAACLVTAYLRPFALRTSFGLSYENQTVKVYNMPFNERLIYIVLLVFVHHFVLFLLSFFSFSHLFLMLKNTLFSSIFTIILILIVTALFQKERR